MGKILLPKLALTKSRGAGNLAKCIYQVFRRPRVSSPVWRLVGGNQSKGELVDSCSEKSKTGHNT